MILWTSGSLEIEQIFTNVSGLINSVSLWALGQIACLYPVAEPDLYASLKSYILPTPKFNTKDPKTLIQDVPKDLATNWKFDPKLTILHFEFDKVVLPEAVVIEYSSVEV